MRVSILKDSHRQITSNKTGKPVVHHFQEIFVRWEHEPHPRPCQIYLKEGTPPYAPGDYVLDIAASMKIEKDRLGFSDLVLKPATAAPGGVRGQGNA